MCRRRRPTGWEKLYTKDGVPFWTNHNDRTTSWDPPVPAAVATPAVVGVVSEARGVRDTTARGSLGDLEASESVDGAGAAGASTEAVAIGVPVENEQPTRNLGADGRPLPEGARAIGHGGVFPVSFFVLLLLLWLFCRLG